MKIWQRLIAMTSGARLQSNVAIQLCVALAYLLAAFSSLELGVQPIMTRPLWLPAALVAALVFARGSKDWLGLSIGSALFGLYRYYETQGLLAFVFNGLSVAAQVHVGAWLVRRFLAPDAKELFRGKDVIRVAILLGPVMMSIRPLVLFPFLLQANLIPWLNIADRFLEWISTDSLAAFLVMPLLLVFLGQPREWWSKRKWSSFYAQAAIIAGFIVSLQLTAFLEFERVNNLFHDELRVRMAKLETRIDQINAYSIPPNVDDSKFQWIKPLTGVGASAQSIPIKSLPGYGFDLALWAEQEKIELRAKRWHLLVSLDRPQDGVPFRNFPDILMFVEEHQKMTDDVEVHFALGVDSTTLRSIVFTSLWWFQVTFAAVAVLATYIALTSSGSTRKLDIAVQERTASLLAASEQLRIFKAIADQATDGILISNPIIDRDRPDILFVNEAFTRTTQFRPGEFKSPAQLRGPDSDRTQYDKMLKMLAAGKACTMELFHYRKNGERFMAKLNAFPVSNELGQVTHWAGIYRDVTEERQAEQLKREREKHNQERERHELIGRMAGGVAHDFNNLLTAVQGSVEMIRLETREAPEDLLESIEEAVKTGSELTNQLLAFSGKGGGRVSRIDINQKLRSMQKMLQIAIPVDISIRLDLQQSQMELSADPALLSQVIVNLVINAAQAMQGEKNRTAREILIRTRLLNEALILQQGSEDPNYGSVVMGSQLTAPDPSADAPIVSSNLLSCVLSVTDSGTGIAPEILSKVFEPFYSTKSDGTGLGLTAVAGVVKQLRGWMAVQAHSELGGAAFHIGLSVEMSQPIRQVPAHASPNPTSERIFSANATLSPRALIVDDEPAVRAYAIAVIRELGIEFDVAENGLSAQILLKTKIYDLLLTDMTMPKLGGAALIEWVVDTFSKPECPQILVMSGYVSEKNDLQPEYRARIAEWLQKPFSAAVLTTAVRRLFPHLPGNSRSSD